MTVEKPTREKRRRPAAVPAEERGRSAVQSDVRPVDAEARRRARERAGGDD